MEDFSREPDFSGWATKNNLLCSDGRTILPGAFKHQDKARVPLVWQHDDSEPGNVLGSVLLHDRAFGTFAQGFFNENRQAKDAKEGVRNGDIVSLSISANRLKHQRGGGVTFGNITEVSLVLNGANPGALITDINLSHSAEGDIISDEAIIYTGLTLEHSDKTNEGDPMPEENQESKPTDLTVKDVIDGMTPEQKDVMYYLVGVAVEEADGASSDVADDEDEDMEHGDFTTGDLLNHIDNTIKEGLNEMARNTFANNDAPSGQGTRLSHAQFSAIVAEASKMKRESLMDELRHSAGELLQHSGEGAAGVDYGITNINELFPDAKAIETTPEFISRRMEWVNFVLKNTKHIPFAHVKTIHADITEPEARARGYMKGKRKKEEVFKLLKRTTGPTTIYKKQKLDRDDILDITDFNVVVWLQQEMRLMLEEEIARSILVGDGRTALDESKIQDPEGAVQGTGIRSILHDDELYAHKVEIAANTGIGDTIKAFLRGRPHLKGSGRPAMFLSEDILTDMMLEENKFGMPKYETEQALADRLRVSAIVPVEIFSEYAGLIAIFVNLADYSIGTNKGGEITNFDDFDLNFNQHIYLSETRLSGGLTKAKSALVFTRSTGTEVVPGAPTFDAPANKITIPTKTGVTYFINDTSVTGNVVIDEDTEVTVSADEGYYIPAGSTRSWSYTYTAG